MSNEKHCLLMHDIELFLAENGCTVSDVEEIAKDISADVKLQKEASYHYFKPAWALMMYGLAESVKKWVPVKEDISKMNPLNFVNVK